MRRFGERSWNSARPPRKEGMRLSTMVGLLAIVVALMLVAGRPDIWSGFLPSFDSQPPAPGTAPRDQASASSKGNPQTIELVDPASQGQKPAPAQPTRQPNPTRRPSPNTMVALLVVTIAYFVWRIIRISRSVTRRAESELHRRRSRLSLQPTRPHPVASDAGDLPPSGTPQPAEEESEQNVRTDKVDPSRPDSADG